MAYQRKGYNWSGHPVMEARGHYAYVSRLKSVATARQKKFQAFLYAVLQEAGVTPMRVTWNNRRGYMSAISQNVKLATANGIDISREAQDEYWKTVNQ